MLHRGNPHDANALHCDLQYDGENELEAAFNIGNEYFLSAETDGWIIDQDRFNSSRFYLSALDAGGEFVTWVVRLYCRYYKARLSLRSIMLVTNALNTNFKTRELNESQSAKRGLYPTGQTCFI